MIFETHAHYDDEAFDEDRESLLNSVQKEGIEYIVNISSSLQTIKRTIDLIGDYPFVYGAIGVHPDSTKELNEENFQWLKEQAKHPKAIAIGEIGLDYYWDSTERDVQQRWFRRQLNLAKELNKPVVIHSRDAAQDTFEILKAEKDGLKEVVIHCYSYGVEQAKEYVKMGFYLGIGGVITFANGKKLKEVVEEIPLEHMVLETDSPYLAPVPYRGKRNTSLLLPLIAKEIAKIKGIDYETVIGETNKNAKKLYFGNE